MMPTPSGTGFAIFVLIWLLLLALGFLAITIGIGRLVDRRVMNGPGYLVGALAAGAWVWLLVRLDHLGLVTYTLLFLGVPIVWVLAAVVEARRRS